MKKIISVILAACTAATLLSSCAVREDKYQDSLRVGTTELPKNLNPYSSMETSATFFVGLFYDTLLGSAIAPADYVEGESYTFPDGTEYTPIDTEINPLAFVDGLVECEGAFPKAEGSVYGYEYFDPTEEEWKEQCERESIEFGYDESGNPISETEEEFMKRALIAVPNENWMRFRFKVVDGHSWSDGTPFTAEDIKFTFDYIIKHSGALGSQAYFLTDYYKSEVVDGDFVFTLASSNYTSMLCYEPCSDLTPSRAVSPACFRITVITLVPTSLVLCVGIAVPSVCQLGTAGERTRTLGQSWHYITS